jgi:Transposase DDE domain
LDGTEWKIGSFELHVLVLAAQVKGVAIPVYFKVYQHKGVLSENDRINFIRKAFAIIDLHGKLLIADREFIGKEWFADLVVFGLNFVIRLRKGMYRRQIEESGYVYDKLEKKATKKGYSHAIFTVCKQKYRIEMWRSDNKDEPIIYLITNILSTKRVGKQYAKRWKIEYCFKHMKTNGFNLEDMSLTDLKKIRLMISLVIVAYILAIREGIIQQKVQKIRMIKYKNGDIYPAVSVFRNGLQTISNQIVNWIDLDKYLSFIEKKKYSIVKIV